MKIKNILACMLFMALGAFAAEITLNEHVKYQDEKIIQSNIRDECAGLGNQFSQATSVALQSNGWSVIKKSEVDSAAPGVNLKLTILNAFSAGNAFTGHRKSVAIVAELFKDGQLIGTYNQTRNSSGGFGAGFKGSCDVLERCVNTLGKDVAKWMKSQKI